ncbi:MAG TPA: hypothetical protein VFQ65_24640 [Kofleriaceae bacterium]|nr:hypothetical protein [Kofleriaceae bacterium]
MRAIVGFCVACWACGGGSGGNPDAPAHADAAVVDAAIPDASFCPAIATIDVASATEVTVAGDTPALGIFDPSLVYPADASGGAMAYSAVPTQETIRTHVAVSADHGATWTLVAEANTPVATSLTTTDMTECPGGTCTGNLISEVSSLIYDADEPDAAKKWKLFAHRYLVGPNVALHYAYGTIALQTAAQPQGPWSAPQKLIGWNSPSPYSSTGVVVNASSLPALHDCLALTEPGAIWLPGVIDLALGCVYLDGTAAKIRIELLRSTTHGTSWASVGTLLRADDAACSGLGPGLNGADLYVTNGTEYVVATPSDTTGYRGCMVFPIDDPAAGKVRRDAQGRAVVAQELTTGQFNGACTFADGANGTMLDVGFFQSARPFRIYRP